jgi:hypothetical protein
MKRIQGGFATDRPAFPNVVAGRDFSRRALAGKRLHGCLLCRAPQRHRVAHFGDKFQFLAVQANEAWEEMWPPRVECP